MNPRNIADISKEAIQIADILSDFTCKYSINKVANYFVLEHRHCLITYCFNRGVAGYSLKATFTGSTVEINLRSVLTQVEMSYLFTVARVRKDMEAHNKRTEEINNSKQKFGEAMRARFNIK
jgi:hypothetical protein